MSDELNERIAELERENDKLHADIMELTLQHSEITLENDMLWKFVMLAKGLDRLLQKNNPHRGSKEYIQFMMGFHRLQWWLGAQMKLLEKQTAKPTDPPADK